MSDKVIPVRVALRVRPLVAKEICDACQVMIKHVPNEPQVVLGHDKAFTFDYVFSQGSTQEELYNTAIADRVECLFKGYNVTVLAYGQTGSGKTFTMGTAYSSSSLDEEAKYGVIQRAVKDIFKGIEKSKDVKFSVKVSFLEVYKEDVYDLLQKTRDCNIVIRENQIVGLTEQTVHSYDETLQALELGSMARTTASTSMNARSSRSHAIFTITLELQSLADEMNIKRGKFHLVDLAGSERAHKTNAVGDRFKEGVNINKGLLALGNVISSLCDDASHVPYRDSKLTRLLQDSLGGNSHTVMIACVSPADVNFDETVNTLRYADRARKIKNKPVVNLDPQNSELVRLREQVMKLQSQLLQNQPITPKLSVEPNNEKMSEEMATKVTQLDFENKRLTKELQYSLDHGRSLMERALLAETNKEDVLKRMIDMKDRTNSIIDVLMDSELGNEDVMNQLRLLQEFNSNLLQFEQSYLAHANEPTIQEDLDFDMDSDAANGEENVYLESTLKQAKMNRQLQDLDRALAIKEELALKMNESDAQMASMRKQWEANVKQMEEEILTLQREKDDLSSALKAVQASKNANKISEQRRKRLQELEQKIADMKKIIQEKSRILKLKQEAEAKVTSLQAEIGNMKTNRVKLMKQIKEESERYRSLKVEKEREVAQLKQKDRKRQYEMSKLKNDFSKQKTVFKRKLEEAAAANKRLNDALHQQKQVAERRSKEKMNSIQGIGTRVKHWLSQEIEVILSSKEAQHHLSNLLEDRKTIAEQLNSLQKTYDRGEPPRKRSSSAGSDVDDGDAIANLERELRVRNSQISNLQQQILDADQDEKNKHLWESITSLVEAKCALKFLFESLINSKTETFSQTAAYETQCEAFETQIQNQKEDIASLQSSKDSLSQFIRTMKHHYEEKLTKMTRENEDKTLYLLKQLNSTSTATGLIQESDLSERNKFLEQELNKFEYLHEEVVQKDKEIAQLKQELEQSRLNRPQKTLLGNLCDLGPKKVPKKPGLSKAKEGSLMGELLNAYDEYFSSSDDEENDDPDWRLTPLFKRNRSKLMRTKANDSSESGSSTIIKKSNTSTSAASCYCRVGGCKSNRCSCYKNIRACQELCKCQDTCCNKEPRSSEKPSEIIMNQTFSAENTNRLPLAHINRLADDANDSTEDFIEPNASAQIEPSHLIDDSGVRKVSLFNKSRKYFTALDSPNF